jgi:hypothetical protein
MIEHAVAQEQLTALVEELLDSQLDTIELLLDDGAPQRDRELELDYLRRLHRAAQTVLARLSEHA